MQILLVEDDEALAQGIATALRQGAYEVEVLQDGRAADGALSGTKNYDLVVLDLTLPNMDGSEVLRRMRERKNRTPVLVLTARAATQDRVIGLDAGADDYMTKPFALAELEARIRALLRRGSPAGPLSGDTTLVLDGKKRVLRIGPRQIELSGREVDILEPLYRNLNEVVSREQLLMHLSVGEEDVGENALEVYIHRLRRKLDAPGLELKTIRGLGYMLIYSP